MESGAILSLLLNALYALGNLKKAPALVKAAFELKLMSLIGFEPLADACAYCRHIFPAAPQTPPPAWRGSLRSPAAQPFSVQSFNCLRYV